MKELSTESEVLLVEINKQTNNKIHFIGSPTEDGDNRRHCGSLLGGGPCLFDGNNPFHRHQLYHEVVTQAW